MLRKDSIEIENQNSKMEKDDKEEHKQRRQELKEKSRRYVLTISASDYVNGVGRELKEYRFEGITGRSLEEMVSKGEKIEAEVIVDVRPAYEAFKVFSELYLIGTGLIPRKK